MVMTTYLSLAWLVLGFTVGALGGLFAGFEMGRKLWRVRR
jgi:hypothetical protein